MGSAHSPRGITVYQVQDSSHFEVQGNIPAGPTADVPPMGTPSILPYIDESMFKSSHIQKVVVEQIMCSESLSSSYSQSRIRTFSGRLPKLNGEVDYDACRTQVELLLCDSSLSENQKV